MSSVVISGDTSGAITVSAPLVAGTNTLTLPATTGTVLADTTVGVCRAWVNFNGTGTVAIRASFNVTSITDGGVGLYTLNFTTVMTDANYCLAGITGFPASVGAESVRIQSTLTSSAAPIATTTAATFFDSPTVTVAIFR